MDFVKLNTNRLMKTNNKFSNMYGIAYSSDEFSHVSYKKISLHFVKLSTKWASEK